MEIAYSLNKKKAVSSNPTVLFFTLQVFGLVFVENTKSSATFTSGVRV